MRFSLNEKTIDVFCLTITADLENGTISLRINQYDILFNGEVVYHSRDRDDSLALFFFKDGLRELSFMKGISRDEIKEFLRIISLDYEKKVLDDDIVTLLWEKDFRNIRYVVDDAFLSEDGSYEQGATEQAKAAAGGGTGIMHAYNSAANMKRTSAINVLHLTDNDVSNIVREVENDLPEKTRILIQLLFEMFQIAQAKEEYEETRIGGSEK